MSIIGSVASTVFGTVASVDVFADPIFRFTNPALANSYAFQFSPNLTPAQQGDVSVSKEQDFVDRGDNSVYWGDTISYTIEVTNLFGQTLDLMIQDAMSAYVDYVAGTLQGPLDESFTSGALLNYTLDPGDTLTISFDVEVRYDAPIGDFIINTATVSYFDPIANAFVEDSDTVQVRVEAIPEPTTFIFFGVGLLGLLAVVRRRRNMRK